VRTLDNMRWFSHQRRTGRRKAPRTTPASRRQRVLPSPCHHPAATQWYHLLLRAAYGIRCMPYDALSMGWLSRFSFFCPWWPWPLILTFELGRDFCTVHLTAKFHHPIFNRSEVIMLTNKQTNWQTDATENIHLHRKQQEGQHPLTGQRAANFRLLTNQ